jgi:CRISPR-associated endoribonuclease Cas6
MRVRIEIKLLNPGRQTIPVNYQYPVSAWIYKTISKGNHAFADFLHSKGFGENGKSYKFFSFSWLEFPIRGCKIEGDRLHLLQAEAAIEISFLAPEALQHFVIGLFQDQQFSLGDKISRADFVVVNVNPLAAPSFSETMYYRTLSPMLISKNREGQQAAAYLSPDADDYATLFINNLINRYQAAKAVGLLPDAGIINPEDIRFTCDAASIRRKGIIIKANTPAQTKIIPYHCNFSLSAPIIIHQLGYLSGFGEKNSLGLGLTQISH